MRIEGSRECLRRSDPKTCDPLACLRRASVERSPCDARLCSSVSPQPRRVRRAAQRPASTAVRRTPRRPIPRASRATLEGRLASGNCSSKRRSGAERAAAYRHTSRSSTSRRVCLTVKPGDVTTFVGSGSDDVPPFRLGVIMPAPAELVSPTLVDGETIDTSADLTVRWKSTSSGAALVSFSTPVTTADVAATRLLCALDPSAGEGVVPRARSWQHSKPESTPVERRRFMGSA